MSNSDRRRRTPHTADGSPARHFVNHLRVSLSLSEVHLDLATLGGGHVDLLPVWHFVTTPDHLLTMHGELGVALDSYRARFGDIMAIGSEPSKARPDGDDRDG